MLPPLEQLEVYCINLDRRPDRWSHAQAAWARLGCAAEHLHRVRAVDTQSYVGCARSHQKCVRLAQEAGLPFICVVEDDVDFRPNSAEIYESLRQKLPENCSILYGGVSWAGSAEAEIVPGIRCLGQCTGLFCVVYFASAYEAVLAWQQGDGNIDRFLGHRKDITRMVTIPYLAGTTSGHSDLRKRQTRDADIIERVERKFLDCHPAKSMENVIALGNTIRRGSGLKVSRAVYTRGIAVQKSQTSLQQP